jgi:hypothetical protein
MAILLKVNEAIGFWRASDSTNILSDSGSDYFRLVNGLFRIHANLYSECNLNMSNLNISFTNLCRSATL